MLTTNDDVRSWAVDIVAAKGTKFTPLTKGDQFAIAKLIMELDAAAGYKVTDTSPTDGGGETIPASTTESSPTEQDRQPDPSAVKDALDNPVRTMPMTRGYAYHRARFTAQETFDKFLEAVKEGKAEAKVMDFSTGRQSTDASFAYWLAETIEVGLPPMVRNA